MANSTIWNLIQKYVTGNISPEARRKLQQWMDEDPANEELVMEVKKICELTPDEGFDVNVQEAWEHFSHSKKQSKLRLPKHQHVRRSSDYFGNLLRVAAIILIAACTGFFAHAYLVDSSDHNDIAQQEEFYIMQNLTTDMGEKARVTFSDGTEVTLNSASSLSFPKEFHGSTREIYLDGEAYFKVSHNPGHPFIVHSQDVEIQVLGTEFNVRGWTEDTSVDVVVREGKVAVHSTGPELQDRNSSEVILNEGFYTSVKRGQKPDPAQKVDVRNYLLWRSGGMHFNNVPFRQVSKEIERRFNVQITVSATEILEIPYRGTFQYVELDDILTVIAVSMEVEYRREGSEVEFYR